MIIVIKISPNLINFFDIYRMYFFIVFEVLPEPGHKLCLFPVPTRYSCLEAKYYRREELLSVLEEEQAHDQPNAFVYDRHIKKF